MVQNLDQIESLLQDQAKESSGDSSQDLDHSPVFNPEIQIDKEAFLKFLHIYVNQLQTQNRMNQAMALTEAEHQLNGNSWKCIVKNDLSERLISQDKDLLPYLRDQLSLPQLFLEVEISEAISDESSTRPYTPEEKLKAMAEKNPSLKKLMKLFNARIIYK
ncbi:MAG: hypothetical protein AAF694_24445 [Bacteroidota bacterium]